MYHVYLAGPISGLSYDACTDWRQQFAQLLMFEKDVRCLSPMRGKEYLAREERVQHCYPEKVLSCERGIMTRDFFDAQRSDLVVAYLLGATAVSVGTVMEIAWAYQARTPVIAIMEPSQDFSLNPVDRAWLAALIDGEGSIVIHRTSSKNIHYQVGLHVSMTSRPVLEKVFRLAGVGTLRPLKKREQERKQMFAWRCVSQQAAAVIRQVYPDLIEKKPEAALALELMQLKEGKQRMNFPSSGQCGFQEKPVEMVAAEEDIYQRYKALRIGEKISFATPLLHLGNPHDHPMVREAIGFRVETLQDAVHTARMVLWP